MSGYFKVSKPLQVTDILKGDISDNSLVPAGSDLSFYIFRHLCGLLNYIRDIFHRSNMENPSAFSLHGCAAKADLTLCLGQSGQVMIMLI